MIEINLEPEKQEDDIVELVEYNPEWPNQFEREKTKLRKIFSHPIIEIEHIGSTAVSGLCAKPILDILIGCHESELNKNFPQQLLELGYVFEFFKQDVQWVLFNRRITPPSINLHIIPRTLPAWHKYIKFRNILRSDTKLRKKYEQVKRKLALETKEIETYTDGKTPFIQKCLEDDR